MESNIQQKGTGLQELQKDYRDFVLGRVFDLPDLSELPDEFMISDDLIIKDQGSSDYCTAYATCCASELQEGVELVPEFSFAASKSISGNKDSWGQDLRSACKGHVQYGALATFDYSEDGEDPRDLETWLQYLGRAKNHKKESFFSVEGKYDSFDNIRASMWKFRAQKRAVPIGLVWNWSTEQYELVNVSQSGSGHAMCVVGWSKDGFLYVVNSYGKEAGKDGIHKISREIINEFVPRFGAFMFIDMPKTEAKMRNKYGIMENDSFITAIVKIIQYYLMIKL